MLCCDSGALTSWGGAVSWPKAASLRRNLLIDSVFTDSGSNLRVQVLAPQVGASGGAWVRAGVGTGVRAGVFVGLH